MTHLVFFYGTLMAGFERRRRAGIDRNLTYIGRGSIEALLFDLDIYPAAVPAPGGCVWGEVYDVQEVAGVLASLDDIEGCDPEHPDRSLYLRRETDATLADGSLVRVWVYFYNAPLGRAPRVPSGDYVKHLRAR